MSFILFPTKTVMWFALLGALSCSFSLQAATYVLAEGEDVIGRVQHTTAAGSDTLLDIARRFNVGFNAIKAANPDVDPWMPGVGTRVLIPNRFVLPSGRREGIVVNVAEMRLYYFFQPEGSPPLVSTYPISIGREGWDTPLGEYKVVHRLRRPSWTVPASVHAEAEARGERMPRVVLPGPDNPLGEYAMTLDAPGYLIHGTNRPYSIGMRASHGCVRLYPEDIELLINRTPKETPVRIVDESFKHGYRDGVLYLEVHKPTTEKGELNLRHLVNQTSEILPPRMWEDDWRRLRQAAEQALGIAEPVVRVAPPNPRLSQWLLDVGVYTDIEKAREVMLKIERLEYPVSLDRCNDQSCRLVVGPFRDQGGMSEVSKKVKWVVGYTPTVVRYEYEADGMSTASLVASAAD